MRRTKRYSPLSRGWLIVSAGGKPSEIMIDAMHLEADRTAAF
jgi:hypothetical protein